MKDGYRFTFSGILLCCLLPGVLMLPALAFAAADNLLDGAGLSARLDKTTEYQLLDARGAEARRNLPLAFSTRYQPLMPVKKGLVFVVADSDEAALEIAANIPAEGRTVYAVKGGAEVWKQVQSSTATTVRHDFVVPKGTCDLGKPSLQIKVNPDTKVRTPTQKTDKK